MIRHLQSQRGRYAYDEYTQALASIFNWTDPISDNSYALETDPYFYSKIKRDPVFGHVILTAKRVCAGREWKIEPASERPVDQLRAAIEESALRQIKGFSGARFNLAEGLMRGSAYARIDGARRLLDDVEGVPPAVWWVPTQLHDVDRRRFRLARRPSDDAVVWEFWSVKDFAWHVLEEEQRSWFVRSVWHDTEDTLGYGWGIYDALTEYAKAKTRLLSSALSAGDRFGEGLVTYGLAQGTSGDAQAAANSPTERAAAAREAIRKSRRDNVITYPVGDEIDFLEPSGTGHRFLLELIEYLDKQIRTLVLGSDLPSSSSSGSYALAVVQEHSSEAIGTHNRDKLSEDLTDDLIGLWGRVNALQLRRLGLGGSRPGKFTISDEGVAEDVGAFASALETLARVGVPVSTAEVYARTSLSEPKPGEPTTKLDPVARTGDDELQQAILRMKQAGGGGGGAGGGPKPKPSGVNGAAQKVNGAAGDGKPGEPTPVGSGAGGAS